MRIRKRISAASTAVGRAIDKFMPWYPEQERAEAHQAAADRIRAGLEALAGEAKRVPFVGPAEDGQRIEPRPGEDDWRAEADAAQETVNRIEYDADPDRWLAEAAADLRDAPEPERAEHLEYVTRIAGGAGGAAAIQVEATADAWREAAITATANEGIRDDAAERISMEPELTGDLVAALMDAGASPEVLETAVSAGLGWAGCMAPGATEADYDPPRYDDRWRASHSGYDGPDRSLATEEMAALEGGPLPLGSERGGDVGEAGESSDKCGTCHRDAHRPGMPTASHGHPYAAPDLERGRALPATRLEADEQEARARNDAMNPAAGDGIQQLTDERSRIDWNHGRPLDRLQEIDRQIGATLLHPEAEAG